MFVCRPGSDFFAGIVHSSLGVLKYTCQNNSHASQDKDTPLTGSCFVLKLAYFVNLPISWWITQSHITTAREMTRRCHAPVNVNLAGAPQVNLWNPNREIFSMSESPAFHEFHLQNPLPKDLQFVMSEWCQKELLSESPVCSDRPLVRSVRVTSSPPAFTLSGALL